ncbi:DUF5406 family protein [Xenorhabdus bovienii]|nr:DUF5406 family protein [Xenorhabdus bovienii]
MTIRSYSPHIALVHVTKEETPDTSAYSETAEMEKVTYISVMNYDHNLTLCMRNAEHVVRLTFAQWEYRQVVDVVVTANIRGLDVISQAVQNLYDSLSTISFFNHDTDKDDGMAEFHVGILKCIDEGQEGVEWLNEMLIKAEIISIKPEVKSC